MVVYWWKSFSGHEFILFYPKSSFLMVFRLDKAWFFSKPMNLGVWDQIYEEVNQRVPRPKWGLSKILSANFVLLSNAPKNFKNGSAMFDIFANSQTTISWFFQMETKSKLRWTNVIQRPKWHRSKIVWANLVLLSNAEDQSSPFKEIMGGKRW